MGSALMDLHPFMGRYPIAYPILIVVPCSAIAIDGQSIVSTIVSLNIVYVSAVGLLFVLHKTGGHIEPRCASMMLVSGAALSLTVTVAHWICPRGVPSWLPLAAGLLASACTLLGWQVLTFRRRVQP